MSRILYFLDAANYTLAEDGLRSVLLKSYNNIREMMGRTFQIPSENNSFLDVLFVNGCDYSVPHPIRYRVSHQMEQLRAGGISCGMVNAWDLDEDQLRHARTFIFFRCPITDDIKEFIQQAKSLNKRVLYDIDDLVFDLKYTSEIPYIRTMEQDDRAAYDDGVVRMGETLLMCDGAITTTEALARELKKYVPMVFVNRNTASDDMLMLSNDALFRRDELPQLDAYQVPYRDRKKYRVAKKRNAARKNIVKIGYFSGSITHNADFELVLLSLVSVFKARSNVRLVVAGELDIPEDFKPYKDRIEVVPFCDWKRLPYLIASVDINIAPIQDTLFNQAKSENKWIEASLVKVPTIASDVGAFSDMIKQNLTGLLCSTEDEWRDALLHLVDSPDDRARIGQRAFEYCTKNCTTIRTGHNLANYIRKVQTPNIAMVMPSMNTSGGVLVAFKHAAILQDAGKDVFFINSDNSMKWKKFEERQFPVLNRRVPSGKLDKCPFTGWIDNGVATLWDTLDFIQRYPKVKKRSYFVQNYETDFYLPGDQLRWQANATYSAESDHVTYITISSWCMKWLCEDFGIRARFAPNGLDAKRFYPVKRKLENRKVRVLVEGDCNSKYKNVDESFFITNQLDPEKFEIWYMTYTGTKKPYYRVDNFLGSVSHDTIANVYRDCDILLKTSILESFSYPPLEMMATGGYVVAIPNGGNAEYLENEKNCLLYNKGQYQEAIEAILRVCTDENLRNTLFEEGVKTAMARDWGVVTKDVLDMYR